MAPPREAQSISDLQELNNTAFQRQSKESSTSSNDTTDEEIVDLVQKAPVVTLRNKIGTQVGTDANFNTIKPKRWSRNAENSGSLRSFSKSFTTLNERIKIFYFYLRVSRAQKWRD